MLRMFRLLVSSRYRLVRKMQLHLVIFAFFIQYLKRIIHHSFESSAPTYGDSHGIAGQLLGVSCKCGGITLGLLLCWDFLMCRVGQRARLLPSACPYRAELIPGLWKVKIIFPAHLRRWGSS